MTFSTQPVNHIFGQNRTLVFPKLIQKNLEKGRVYVFADGSQQFAFPSITRVLKFKPKPELEAWKLRVGPEEAERQRDYAANKGHGLHTIAEEYLNNKPLSKVLPQVAQLWQHLRPWLKDNIKSVWAQEQDVASFKFTTAGRLDILAELMDGTLAIIDIKNAKRRKKAEWIHDYFLQGTFYALAVYELTKIPVPHIIFPVVSPEGIQIFRTTAKNHFRTLDTRINEFFEKYELEPAKEIDKQAPPVV